MTIVARTLVSVPARSASDTWDAVVAMIAPDANSPARRELAAVAGVACSCISDEALAEDAIVVHGVGPRLRIYALYGDDSVDGDRANESSLSWVPTNGDWRMSIPCFEDDLSWVQAKLAKSSNRVSARPIGADVEGEDGAPAAQGRVGATQSGATDAVDLDAFFRR
jgi:hypothetical protein